MKKNMKKLKTSSTQNFVPSLLGFSVMFCSHKKPTYSYKVQWAIVAVVIATARFDLTAMKQGYG